MAVTRSKGIDIKSIIRETITELLSDDSFVSRVADKVKSNLGIDELVQKVKACEAEISALRDERALLLNQADMADQYNRRNNIRIFGIKEVQDENIETVVLEMFQSKLNVSLQPHDMDRCHRVGKPRADGKRPVIVKFLRYSHKIQVISNQRRLKGSHIFIAEDLTSSRYKLLKQSMEKWDKKNVWLYNGKIYVNTEGKRIVISSQEDLNEHIKVKLSQSDGVGMESLKGGLRRSIAEALVNM